MDAKRIWSYFFVVNVILINITLVFYLDFIISLLVGIFFGAVNLYSVYHFSLKVVKNSSVNPKFFPKYLLKYGFSVLYLYLSLIVFEVSPIGFLVGVSAIVFAIFLLAFEHLVSRFL